MPIPVQIAVLPVAGLGTRFLPATKSIAKEMLPVVDKPLVAYAVEEALRAGIRTFVFITSRHKKSIEDYFDEHPEMASELEAAGKEHLLEVLSQTLPRNATFLFQRQWAPNGTADAVYRAQPVVRDAPFAVLFPDELMVDRGVPALGELIEVYAKTEGKSVIGVVEVPKHETPSYGILKPGCAIGTGVFNVEGIVEKPKYDPPSNYAAIGRYVFSAGFMREVYAVHQVLHGRETCLTDAVERAAQQDRVVAKVITARRFDCGSKQGYMQAACAIALQRADLGPGLETFLRKELKEKAQELARLTP